MSSFTNIEQYKDAIEHDGFLFLQDTAVGKRADDFARKGYPVLSQEGLEFCKTSTFNDQVSDHVHLYLESLLIASSEFMISLNQHLPDVRLDLTQYVTRSSQTV